MDYSPPDSSVHGIFQARILASVSTSFSRGSSRPRDWTQVFCVEADFLPSAQQSLPQRGWCDLPKATHPRSGAWGPSSWPWIELAPRTLEGNGLAAGSPGKPQGPSKWISHLRNCDVSEGSDSVDEIGGGQSGRWGGRMRPYHHCPWKADLSTKAAGETGTCLWAMWLLSGGAGETSLGPSAAVSWAPCSHDSFWAFSLDLHWR